MKVRPSELFPLFRSDTQGAIVADLFSDPDHEWTVAELEARTGASAPTISRELTRLVTADLARSRTHGARQRSYRANREHPLFHTISQIVDYSYGPVPILEELLGNVDGISEAHIFGSWAARRAGEAGHPPRDIDLLIIGDPAREPLEDALQKAERRLQREVNVTRMSHDRWQSADDPFTQGVRSRPLHALTLDHKEPQ